MRNHPLFHITKAKFLEFVREPEAIFWVLVFPVLLSLALGVAFRSKPADRIAVAVEAREGADRIREALASDRGLLPRVLPESEAREALRTGRVAVVVVPGSPLVYRFDPARDESRVARLAADAAIQRAAGRSDPRATANLETNEPGGRYIDFLVPGLLGMNLMGTGMWGIGFAIVTARSRGLVKRMIATPMRRRHYLAGQMLGRMVFLVPEVAVLVGFAHFAFGVPMKGTFAGFAVVTLLGAIAFTGIGLVVAARPRTVEGVSGLMNFVMLPMWVFSGVFFSPARFPDALQPAIRLLPLTALNDALRAVMIDGKPLLALSQELAVVAAWGALSFAVALKIFRWK